MTRIVDLAIVGSGFSGSLMAMIARRLGKSVLLLERGQHPRFAIGESSTPLASLLLERIARRYDLPRLLPFTKYGTWRKHYPDIGCGLKRGFSFFRHDVGRPFSTDAERRDQLLVAASPHNEIGDVHWYRPDFDHFLVREASALGAEYLDGVTITEFLPGAGGCRLRGSRRADVDRGPVDTPVEVVARFVVDASGPRGFLHRALGLGERELPGLPSTQSLYSHFTGVKRFVDVEPEGFTEVLPYPPDAAALHHVFEGGWIWVLRFDNGITSAGVAATGPLAAELGLSEGAAGWSRLIARFPSIEAQFADAKPTREFTWLPRLSFASDRATGDGWAMLPSAAGIVDPLLSTGFPLTLLGIERIAAAIAEDWGTDRFAPRLEAYARRTADELAVTSRLVGALYGAFDDWERFTALSHLYFAAASFTEASRRLDDASPAGDQFLLGGRPIFATALDRCLDLAAVLKASAPVSPTARTELAAAIAQTIDPVNIAGLADPTRRNWYPCTSADLFAGTEKLGASEAAIEAMLERCGFADSLPTLRLS